jgi:dynein heavy chain
MLKTINKPHEIIELLFNLIMLLRPIDGIGENDGWNGAKLMMASPNKFVDELKKFSNKIGNVPEKTIGKIRNIINKESDKLKRMKEVSTSADNIYGWLQNSLNLYDINKKVEPMKKKVAEMTKKLIQLQSDLEATESLLERLNSELNLLNENKKIKQAQLDELTNQAQLMERRLNAATKLITGLSRE